MKRLAFALVSLIAIAAQAPAQEKPAKKAKARPTLDTNAMAFAGQYQWADWVEKDFPFFSSVLDAREVGEGFPKDNLTPRGIILNLGHDLWACFDTDLLRIAAIWQGKGVTPVALATGSYRIAGQKTKDGQDDLPKPDGTVWLANGIYPGWQVLKSPDDKPTFTDSREPGPSANEVGRGPCIESGCIFRGAAPLGKNTTLLQFDVGDASVKEELKAFPKRGGVMLRRFIKIARHTQTICAIIGNLPDDKNTLVLKKDAFWNLTAENLRLNFSVFCRGEGEKPRLVLDERKHLYVVFPPSDSDQEIYFGLSNQEDKAGVPLHASSQSRVWPQVLTTHAKLSTAKDAYVVDDIPLPLDNPWKRNIRLADIAFFKNKPGEAAAVTLDGDVWLLSGLSGDLQEVKWKRFASGLHEPMSICIRDEEIFVFDRNGIWKLRDENGDREADVYEMFCNRFAQTAETREFPNSMKLAPDGSFVISKGGQQGTTLGKHNGTVIRVSPDGTKFDVIGWGLRQPFVGVNPKTGLVTASDQEGNYTPTTPLQIIRDHQYYGFLSELQPHEKYPQTIADPLTWIPHPVCASGATQVWLADAKMGAVNDEMILVSYNKPELFRVLIGRQASSLSRPADVPPVAAATPASETLASHDSQDGRLPRQAAVVGWVHDLDFPTLNGAINPADGQLYVTGFQVWGTTVKRISGLARIRSTGEPRVLVKEVTAMDKGVLLKFSHPLDKAAAGDVANYSIERWNYRRTFNYGSPHLKLDGTPGQEWMQPSSAYLSKDATSVFIGIPDMKAGVMQMRVGWGIKGAEGLPARNNAYFTPYELAKFEPEKEGFEKISVDLTPRKVIAAAQVAPTKEEGERLYQMMGCVACHSIDGVLYGKVGPTWKGLYGSQREFAKGVASGKADDAYLKESIVNPSAKIVKGFEKFDTGMPIYSGVLTDSQIDSIILYIKSLK